MKTKLCLAAAAATIFVFFILPAMMILAHLNSDKSIEPIPEHISITELTDSYGEGTGRLVFVPDVTASRTITLPDRDMDWQELMWESYQQGYAQGVKDSQTSTEK